MTRSTTHGIHTDNKAQSQQIQALQDKVTSSNALLEQLVKDVQNFNKPSPPTAPLETTKDLFSMKTKAQPMTFMAATTVDFGQPTESISAEAHYVDIAPVAPMPPLPKVQPPPPALPPSIVALNVKRQRNVLKSSPEMHEPPKKSEMKRPPCLDVIMPQPTVHELSNSLVYVFNPMHQVHSTANAQERRSSLDKDVGVWIHLLDHFARNDVEVAKQQKQLVELLATLNDCLDKAPDSARRSFYHVSSTRHIDALLQRLVEKSGSVRLEKEVEEFEDVRDEWMSQE
jgi:hypothetical protein